MAFFPELIGWSKGGEEEWLRAARYFYTLAEKSGRSLSAWRGHYLNVALGGEDGDLVDIYAYVAEPKDEAAEGEAVVSVHMHTAGPHVWALEPIYEVAENLPSPLEASLVCMMRGNDELAIAPIDVVTRHILDPASQARPFLAQMSMLCSKVLFFEDVDAYLDYLDETDDFLIGVGQVFSPAFTRHYFEETAPEDRPRFRPSGEDKIVFVNGIVAGHAEHLLHGIDFLLEIQLETPFGGLTLLTNREATPGEIIPGQMCVACGILSADLAIYDHAAGFGH